MCSSTLSLTSALDGVGRFNPGKDLMPTVQDVGWGPLSRVLGGAHCTGCWVGPRAGLNKCGKSSSQIQSYKKCVIVLHGEARLRSLAEDYKIFRHICYNI
jgi:hypothetical protein